MDFLLHKLIRHPSDNYICKEYATTTYINTQMTYIYDRTFNSKVRTKTQGCLEAIDPCCDGTACLHVEGTYEFFSTGEVDNLLQKIIIISNVR